MKMSVSEVAKLLGVSVRTLHYYDEIGLLTPSQVTQAGYRYYDENALSLLQQIMFFRELEFSLQDIKSIISNPDYDRQQALSNHRELLILKRNHLNDLLTLVDETIGGKEMSKKDFTADDVIAFKQKHADEVRNRWGDTAAYKESEKKHADYTPDKEMGLAKEAFQIIEQFSLKVGTEPASDEVQSLVKKWQDYITDNHYNCTKEILSCLGQMYIADERFEKNIDRYCDGTAKLMSQAIEIYCK